MSHAIRRWPTEWIPKKQSSFPGALTLNISAVSTFNRQHCQTFTFFCNRSWEPRYGVDVLARAFVKVAQQNENVDLLMLGGGSQGNAFARYCKTVVCWTGSHLADTISQTDLPHWYHRADLYISPSHVDGSSVSLMEALACGIPCLVSDIPANKEWVVEDENGWLFRDGDANHLAEKILAAISQREKLPEIGRSSRRSAEMRADWKKNAEALMNVYRSIIGRKNMLNKKDLLDGFQKQM